MSRKLFCVPPTLKVDLDKERKSFLKTAAAIAAIVSALVAVITFGQGWGDASSGETDADVVATIDSVSADDDPTLRDLRNALNAARSIGFAGDKADALRRVVGIALEQRYYGIAIDAAESIGLSNRKSDQLELIVDHAIQNREFGYASEAAAAIPFSSRSAEASRKVVEAVGSSLSSRGTQNPPLQADSTHKRSCLVRAAESTLPRPARQSSACCG